MEMNELEAYRVQYNDGCWTLQLPSKRPRAVHGATCPDAGALVCLLVDPARPSSHSKSFISVSGHNHASLQTQHCMYNVNTVNLQEAGATKALALARKLGTKRHLV